MNVVDVLPEFPVLLAEPLPGDERTLVQWSIVNLRHCETWLVKRGLLSVPDDLLGRLRRGYRQLDVHAIRLGLAEMRTRRVDLRRVWPKSEELAAFAARIGADLQLYRPSLRDGKVDELLIVPVNGTITPLYLVELRELFVPRWQIVQAATLFAPNPLFPTPRRATLSWMFFQSLVLTTQRSDIPTAASFLGIRESD